MDPKFYDFIILELTKWSDVIDRKPSLMKDLTVIE